MAYDTGWQKGVKEIGGVKGTLLRLPVVVRAISVDFDGKDEVDVEGLLKPERGYRRVVLEAAGQKVFGLVGSPSVVDCGKESK